MPRRRRLVVLGLLAAGIAVAWATAQRDDDSEPGQAAAAAAAKPGTTTEVQALAGIGSLRDRLERLPAVAPGDLDGTIDLGGNGARGRR